MRNRAEIMLITLIRHGETKGNLEKRYIGKTEEEVCREGIASLRRMMEKNKYPLAKKLVTSPMLRCIQTARILYPGKEYEIREDFRECNFGLFENESYQTLRDNRDYQRWLKSQGKLPFPGGESMADFKKRCREEFESLMSVWEQKETSLVLIVHGGTIMAIMEEFCDTRKAFYDWQVKNGEGFICSYDKTKKKLTMQSRIIREE